MQAGSFHPCVLNHSYFMFILNVVNINQQDCKTITMFSIVHIYRNNCFFSLFRFGGTECLSQNEPFTSWFVPSSPSKFPACPYEDLHFFNVLLFFYYFPLWFLSHSFFNLFFHSVLLLTYV